jgi:hypothetical protein
MSRLTLSETGTELLDDPAADPATVAQALHHIARANRWFGGWAAVRYGLARLVPDSPGRTLTLLDVGTGLGDLPLQASEWGRSRGISIRPLGLDRHPDVARLAGGRGLPTAAGCGGDLPIRDRGVDLVIVSQVAHHLDEASCRVLFRECHRVAALGVVVADLQPSRLAQLGFWLGGHLLRFDAVTIGDGITSLRRGFTVARLDGLLREADIHATVTRRPGSRVVAWWRV